VAGRMIEAKEYRRDADVIAESVAHVPIGALEPKGPLEQVGLLDGLVSVEDIFAGQIVRT
jgi:hypothetical protein